MRNNKGPRILPWGTPEKTSIGGETQPLHISCSLKMRSRGKRAVAIAMCVQYISGDLQYSPYILGVSLLRSLA